MRPGPLEGRSHPAGGQRSGVAGSVRGQCRPTSGAGTVFPGGPDWQRPGEPVLTVIRLRTSKD